MFINKLAKFILALMVYAFKNLIVYHSWSIYFLVFITILTCCFSTFILESLCLIQKILGVLKIRFSLNL